MLDPQFENFIEPIDEIKSTKEKFQSGFVECDICNLSFCGTSSTLKMHMNDVHQKESQNMKAHEGQEKIISSMNTPTVLIEHDLDKQTQQENETIYVNIENAPESAMIKLEQDTNLILIDPLNIPEHSIKNEENDDERIIDILNIPENPIETEEDSSEQKLINFPIIFHNSAEDPNKSMIPMNDSINSRLSIQYEKYSCKSCGKNIGEGKLKTHERFCAK